MAYPAKKKRLNRKREEKEDVEAAKQLAFRFLSYRSRSAEEVRKKLSETGFSPSAVKKTIARMKELGYLNDDEYARTFGRSCIEHKLWGASRIRDTLLKKGIAPDTITAIMQELAQEHDFSRVARRALEGRFSPADLHGRSGGKTRQRAISYLLRKGFSWSTIASVIGPGPETLP